MFRKNSCNGSLVKFVFMVLLGSIFLSSIVIADINEQIAKLDFDKTTLDDILNIFGEPVKYLWGNQTYTKDNLPNVYIIQYPNKFGIVMANGHINEIRFESPAAGYLFLNQIQVGSSLNDVLSVVGQPTQTIVGQPCTFKDGILYKDINGTVGYCYYMRSDKKVRFFFSNYNVSAIYLTGNVNSLPKITEINKFDDIRSKDLSGLDISDRDGLIETLTFNKETIWPESARMPADWEPNKLMATAMNPGLGVREIHQKGINGVGINVAIIDQPIYLDHPEYKGKIKAYYDTGCEGEQSSMHGPAVTSLLVGANCGTAPGANVYYAAAPSWKKDAAYYTNALNWIIAQNEMLSASEKIRVVSVSAAPSGSGSPFEYNNQMWDDAVAIAEATGILVLDCTSHHGFISRAWYDLDDPENVTKCAGGSPGSPYSDPQRIHVPASCRTTAQHYDYQGRDSYIYWGRGGLSWSIPYCAGVFAMGWQVRPEVTKERMIDFLFQTAYINPDGAKIINPPAFIKLLLENKPLIRLSNSEFKFYAKLNGSGPDPQVLSISNNGLGILNWQISGSCDWLDVKPASGNSTGPDDIDDVTLTITNINPGVHNCQLIIFDPCATNTPQTVSIILYVSNANTKTIQEAINEAENGDTVIIKPGVYMGDGNRDIDFKGKAITLRSIDPNDPDVVASTVIMCQGSESKNHRGFYFHNHETANSVLAGFTITVGYAYSGGGIYCNNSSPTIRNCVLIDNSASYGSGGGICNTSSNPIITNCSFINNSTTQFGGGIRNFGSSPQLKNCLFIGNSAKYGGGMHSERSESNPNLINCTFCNNVATVTAGGMIVTSSNPTLTNCIFWGNYTTSATDEKAQILWGTGRLIINYSCVQGWTGVFGGVGNIGDNPCFVDGGIGDYHLLPDSPCINAGDPNYAAEVNETDLDGRPRIIGGRIDMGAYEFDSRPVAIAGEDQIVYAYIDGVGEIELDGSGSYDPDGDTLTYKWTWAIDGNAYEVNSVNPIIELPIGMHTIELIVNDGMDDSQADYVDVNVVGAIKGGLKVTPQSINLASKGNWIKAHIVLPEGFGAGDVNDNVPVIVEPGGACSKSMNVSEFRVGKQVAHPTCFIEALFDRGELCSGLDNGERELSVVGQFKSGQYFYGSDVIKVIGKKKK